jgi:hypothetical protein
MVVTQFAEIDGITVGTGELSIISGTTTLQTNTTAGSFQLFVDLSPLAKGDIYIIRIYEKVEATGGTKRVVFTAKVQGAQSEVFVAPPLALMNGWDMTIQKSAGTDRALDATIRQCG